MQRKKKRVTTADIARLAGVSRTSVSLALAGRRDVSLSESTRDRIKRCADALGYFPSLLGKGFLHGRSKLIGVLLVVNSYRPVLDLAAAINETLAESDCFPLFMSPDWMGRHMESGYAADRNRAGELSGLRRLLEYQVDGILYFSSGEEHTAACVRELSSRNIPLVILGGVDPFMGAVDIVGGDNEAIGRMGAEHLLSVGCTSFIFGMPASPHPLDAVVRASFAARIEEAGYACNEFTLEVGDLDNLGRLADVDGAGGLAALLSRLGKPRVGVFCARDAIAALVINAASELGWWVPRDLAVAATGHTGLSLINIPPITTVNRNSYTAGELASKLLVRRIEGLEDPPQRILIPPSLQVRASSQSDVSWLLQSRRDAPAAE